MTTIQGIAMGALALVLIGCGGPKDTPPRPISQNSGSPEPAPTGPDGGVAETSKPAEPRPLVAPKGQGGWANAKLDATQVSRRVDAAMTRLDGAFSQSELTFTVPVGNRLNLPAGAGKAVGVVRVQTPQEWSVQYMAIAEGLQGQAIRSDGSKRFHLVTGKTWDAGTNPKSKLPDYPASDAEFIEHWPTAFTKWMHQPMFDGRSFWERTVKAWSAGVGGYNLVFEERPTKLKERTVTHYRLLATTEAKGEKRTIEAVIDGGRMVPVAVRVEITDAGGKETKIAWQAFWGFDMDYEPGSLAQIVNGIEEVKATQSVKKS